MYGPIDYVVVGFKGNHFDGSIVDELSKAVKSGVIRVIDLLFIKKESDGTVAGGEYSDQSDDLKKSFEKLGLDRSTALLSESDMKKVGESMDKDTSAGIMVIEHLWAKDLKKALIAAEGTLVAEGRIHPEAIAAAIKDMETEQQPEKSDKKSKETMKKGGYAHAR
jgi:hypothetical protein